MATADRQIWVLGEPRISDNVNQLWVFGEPWNVLDATPAPAKGAMQTGKYWGEPI